MCVWNASDMDRENDVRAFFDRFAYLARLACVFSSRDQEDVESLYVAFSTSICRRWNSIIQGA